MDNKASSLKTVLTQELHFSYRIKIGICPDFQLVSVHHAVIFLLFFFVNVGLKKVNFFNANNKTKQKLIEGKWFQRYTLRSCMCTRKTVIAENFVLVRGEMKAPFILFFLKSSVIKIWF